jgi:hypothetical protein
MKMNKIELPPPTFKPAINECEDTVNFRINSKSVYSTEIEDKFYDI